jgi:hypothetical protein
VASKRLMLKKGWTRTLYKSQKHPLAKARVSTLSRRLSIGQKDTPWTGITFFLLGLCRKHLFAPAGVGRGISPIHGGKCVHQCVHHALGSKRGLIPYGQSQGDEQGCCGR